MNERVACHAIYFYFFAHIMTCGHVPDPVPIQTGGFVINFYELCSAVHCYARGLTVQS